MHGNGMKVEDLLGDNTGEHDDDANVLTVAAMGNSSLLEDLLRAGKDADVGDAKGRTALVSERTHGSSHAQHSHLIRTLFFATPLAAHRGVQGVRGLRAGAAQARV
jgi:hypothetical protein